VITPEEIRAKTLRTSYPQMLIAWLQDEQLAGFFPRRLPANLTPIKNDLPATIAAVEALRSHSKDDRGWGYTIHWQQRRSRDFGHNQFPDRITIDTLDDLLRLAGRQREFADIRRVVQRLRDEFPELADWLASNVRTLHQYADPLDGLVAVTRFFLNNPWPDCYARQIPVAVDTKFVERHEHVLRQWLNLLLPASAIRVDESKFELRFGLRDGQPHTTVRVLDVALQNELQLPFEELSLPLRSLAMLPVRNATVFIVENQKQPLLQTLPRFKRGIGINGGGVAVTRLKELRWLAENRIIYWGDIDVEGFQILSSLRSLFPKGNVHSIMMDRQTLRHHGALKGNSPSSAEPPHLTDSERAAFRQCAAQGQRLEQEKLPQAYVDACIHELEASIIPVSLDLCGGPRWP
jgi:hypothetical protein